MIAAANLVSMLRALAVDAAGAAEDFNVRGELAEFAKVFKLAMEQNARAFTAAADHIEADQKRFAEHLDAWRVNNMTHAARIAELEAQLARPQPLPLAQRVEQELDKYEKEVQPLSLVERAHARGVLRSFLELNDSYR